MQSVILISICETLICGPAVFSRSADYALRALLVLAREGRAGRFLGAKEVADAIGAPRNYMGKVLNALAKAGLLSSSRGPAGGFRLAKEPESISVGVVADLFGSLASNPRCLNGNAACNPARPCAAHRLWVDVLAAQRAPLDSTTVADLVDRRIEPPVFTPPRSARRSSTPSTKDRFHVIR